MFKKFMQFQTIILVLTVIALGVTFGDILPMSLKQYSFTVSDVMRKVLMFLLPFLIFPYMTTSIAAMKTKGAYLVFGIMGMVLVSNFTSIMIPYFVGTNILPWIGVEKITALQAVDELLPIYDFPLKPLMPMEAAMLGALLTGLYVGFWGSPALEKFFHQYMELSRKFFENIFIPTLPIYVWGTMLKITHENDIVTMFPMFGEMILLIIATQLTYITFLYYVGAGFNFSKTRQAIKNALPSCIVGFSTMSSVVTMPFTLKSAEKNIPEDPQTARVAISTTVNCHDVGECISLPMIALTIYFMTYGSFPDITTYTVFAFFVALAQFGGVSVPGGSIVLILPFLTQDLNFTNEMCSIIIALSIFMDPVGTANNVFGNGAFAMIIHRVSRLAGTIKAKVFAREYF